MANRSLGRGLSALFGEENLDPAVPPTSAEPVRPKNGFRNLPLRRIEPNRAQPRRSFDEKALQELENSISEYRDYTEKKVAAQEEAYAAKLRSEEVQRKLEENTGSISIKKSGRTVTVRRNIEEIEKAEELTEEQEVKVLDFSKPKAKVETSAPSGSKNVVKKGRIRVN